MSVKLLTEHHLELLSLIEGCTGSSELLEITCRGSYMNRLHFAATRINEFPGLSQVFSSVKVFSIIPELRILRPTFHRMSASKY